MLLSQVPRFLRSLMPGVPPPPLLPCAWVPFPKAEGSQYRRVHLFQMAPIGRGGFGIVFATAIEIHTDGVNRPADPLVALAAMKMVPLLKDHSVEVINGLAGNDLVRSGCTPSIARLIDAFCLSTTSPVTECRFPDLNAVGWSDYLWKPFDQFIYERRSVIASQLGASAIKDVNDVQRTARLNGGATLGFQFTELSTRVFREYCTVRASGPLVRLEDENSDAHSYGLKTGRDLAQYVLLKAQSVDALHASGSLHCDVHSGNFVPNITTSFRSCACLLMAPSTKPLREQFFGNDACRRAGMAESPIFLRVADSDKDRTLLKLDLETSPQPMLIDLGGARTMQFPPNTATRKAIADLLFGPNVTYEQLMSIPEHVISTRTPSHDELFSARKHLPSTAPGLIILTAPKTNIYGRPAEQLNPLLLSSGVVGSLDIIAGTRYIAMHSEASDAYSLATAVAETILGFPPFGNVIKASVGERTVAIPFMAPGRARGAHIEPTTNPALTAAPSTSSNRRRYTPNGINDSGSAGLKSVADKVHELCHTPFPTRVRLTGAETRAGEVNIRASTAVSSSSSTSPSSPSYTSSGGPFSTGSSDSEVYNVRPDYPITELAEYLQREIDQRAQSDCPFYGYHPGNSSSPWGNDKCELIGACTAIMARIAAVGLPRADTLDGLKGTFLYKFFVRQKDKNDRMKRRGWLFPALMDTLTYKWKFEYPYAKELATTIVEMLAWDPALRPPVRRLTTCAVFADYFRCTEEDLATIDSDSVTVWSSVRPTIRNLPQVTRDYNFDGSLNKPNLVEMLKCPLPEALMRFNALDWAKAMCWNVLSLQALRRQHTVNSGFMLNLSHRLPKLLPQDAGLVSLFTCLTGVLDCFNGKVCVTFGAKKQARALTEPGTNLIFEKDKNRDAYMHRLGMLLEANEPMASWPFVTDQDIGMAPDSPPPSSPPLSLKRERDSDEVPIDMGERSPKRHRHSEVF